MDKEIQFERNAYSIFVQDKGWCVRVQEEELEQLGYRKADEVKKETAIAIGKEIKELMKSPWANNESLCERRVSIQEALRAVISLCIEKDYGVEL